MPHLLWTLRGKVVDCCTVKYELILLGLKKRTLGLYSKLIF